MKKILLAVVVAFLIFGAYRSCVDENTCHDIGGYTVRGSLAVPQCVRDGRLVPDSLWRGR